MSDLKICASMLCSIRSSLLSINLQNFHVYSVALKEFHSETTIDRN